MLSDNIPTISAGLYPPSGHGHTQISRLSLYNGWAFTVVVGANIVQTIADKG